MWKPQNELEHNRKRRVEPRPLTLRAALKEEGYTEAEIEELIAKARIEEAEKACDAALTEEEKSSDAAVADEKKPSGAAVADEKKPSGAAVAEDGGHDSGGRPPLPGDGYTKARVEEAEKACDAALAEEKKSSDAAVVDEKKPSGAAVAEDGGHDSEGRPPLPGDGFTGTHVTAHKEKPLQMQSGSHLLRDEDDQKMASNPESGNLKLEKDSKELGIDAERNYKRKLGEDRHDVYPNQLRDDENRDHRTATYLDSTDSRRYRYEESHHHPRGPDSKRYRYEDSYHHPRRDYEQFYSRDAYKDRRRP